VNKSLALISSAQKLNAKDSATLNAATAGAAIERGPINEWLRGLCQYLISHLHANPASGDATLEPCNLRVLSAPNHNRNPATTEQ
jgi:hypothetical protein